MPPLGEAVLFRPYIRVLQCRVYIVPHGFALPFHVIRPWELRARRFCSGFLASLPSLPDYDYLASAAYCSLQKFAASRYRDVQNCRYSAITDYWRFSFQMLSRRAPNYKSNHGMEERACPFFPSFHRPPGRAKRLVNIWRQGEAGKDRYFLGSGLGMCNSIQVLQISFGFRIRTKLCIPIHS